MLLLLLVNLSSGIVTPKKSHADAVKSLYDQKKGTVDIAFFGSSHSYRSIFPMQLWEDAGISAMNLATSSQQLVATYYLMREAVRTQKPKVFVLELYGASYSDYKKYNVNLFHSSIDFIPLNFNKLSLWWEQLRHDFSLKEQLEFLFPVIKFHTRWMELTMDDFITDNFQKGGAPTTETEVQSPGKIIRKKGALYPTVEKYLLKICRLCQKEQISLVVFTAPVADDKHYKRICRKINTANELCRENGAIVYEMQDVIEGMNLDYQTDFYNSEHLNLSGAVKLTGWMEEQLLRQFELPDHRGDPRYRDWENDLPRYRENMEELWILHQQQLNGEAGSGVSDGL